MIFTRVQLGDNYRPKSEGLNWTMSDRASEWCAGKSAKRLNWTMSDRASEWSK
jgi:hypothetical protein